MAFLAVVFTVFSLSLLSDGLYHSRLETFGYPVEVADAPAEGGEAAPAGPEPILPLLASADPAAGAAVFKKCASCHTNDPSGTNKTGPGLWNLIPRPVASHPGFGYSSALQAHAAEAPQGWDYEELNGFLWKPKSWVPGTSMGFAGLSKVEDRANVIAYLRTLADSEAPLPTEEEIAAVSAPAEGEVAEGAPAAGEATEGAEGAPVEETVEEVGPAQGEQVENNQQSADGMQPANGAQTPGTEGGVATEGVEAPAGADARIAEEPADVGMPGTEGGVEGAADSVDGSSMTESRSGQALPGNAVEGGSSEGAAETTATETGEAAPGDAGNVPADGGAAPATEAAPTDDAAPVDDAAPAGAAPAEGAEGTTDGNTTTIIVPVEPVAPQQ